MGTTSVRDWCLGPRRAATCRGLLCWTTVVYLVVHRGARTEMDSRFAGIYSTSEAAGRRRGCFYKAVRAAMQNLSAPEADTGTLDPACIPSTRPDRALASGVDG